MNEIQAIGAALSSLRAAGEVVKTIYDAKLSTDVKAKVSDLQELIFLARQAAFDSQEELALVKTKCHELEAKVAQLSQWGDEKKRYVLFQPEIVNSVVFGLRESQSNGEPPHFLCAHCYQKNKKAILNNADAKNGWTQWQCPDCMTAIPSPYRGKIDPVYAPE